MFANLPKVYFKCDNCGRRFETTLRDYFASVPRLNAKDVFLSDSVDEISDLDISEDEQLVILESESTDYNSSPVTCPKCGSTHVSPSDSTIWDHLCDLGRIF